MNKSETHVVTGMSRDLTVTRFNPNLVVDARNIRITSKDGNSTLLAVTNEKGTKEVELLENNIIGKVIGYAVIENDLVLFTTNEDDTVVYDYIFKATFPSLGNPTVHKLFKGNLNFSVDNPIETTTVVETTNIKKVYWVDGLNQPRMINICKEYEDDDNDAFDFCQTVSLVEHTFSIEKNASGGEFPVGTVQYCFSYYNLNGQETNIIDTSFLYYLSPIDRGLPADTRCSNSFSITISNTDTSFEYVRVYCIVRTSENSVPNCRIVGDFKNISSISFIDNGTMGSTIDPTVLYFIGGKSIIAGTIAQKDNTLFLGDIKSTIPTIGNLKINGTKISDLSLNEELIITEGADTGEINCKVFEYDPEIKKVSQGEFYDEEINNLESDYDKKSFKFGENYRLGFIAQYKTGEWSDAVWVGDITETKSPAVHSFKLVEEESPEWDNVLKKPGYEVVFPQSLKDTLRNNGFIRVAPVVVFPKDCERAVLYQGILSGTVYNVKDRADNSPFAQADWRFRMGYDWFSIDHEVQCNEWTTGNMNPIGPYTSLSPTEPMPKLDFINNYGTCYYRDPNIITFHSPDVELSDSILESDLENTYLYIVGFSNSGFSEATGTDEGISISSQQIACSYTDSRDAGLYANPTIDLNNSGEQSIHISRIYNLNYGYSSFLREHNVPSVFYDPLMAQARSRVTREHLCFPGQINIGIGASFVGSSITSSYCAYAGAVYIWNRAPSKTGFQFQEGGNFVLLGDVDYDRKCISELRYGTTTYFNSEESIGPYPYTLNIYAPKLFDSDEIVPKKIQCSTFAENNGEVFYYGNIDKVLSSTYPVTFFKWKTGSFSDLESLKTDFDELDQYCTNWNYNVNYEILSTSGQVGGTTVKIMTSSPIRMRYKSTKHLVFGLKDSCLVGENNRWNPQTKVYWQTEELNLTEAGLKDSMLLDDNPETPVPIYKNISNSVLIGELRRDISSMTRFGGKSLEAFASNIWVRCGKAFDLNEDTPVTLEYKEGDTYIGRYDCLKTYPYSQEDQNSIVSIYSTELESRVNLDLRYDKNRGLQDNTLVTPQNFNLFNRPGYDQTNQFFTYQSLNTDRYTTDYFPNMVTWSLEKSFGEDVDTWTSIPLTSTHTLDGDKGRVTKLITWTDNIFAFQERGFAQLLYNSRVQIPVSDGQPIEITNNMKMTGKRYFGENIGCFNKWTVCSTPLGIYFIDDFKKAIYSFNGQLNNLSNQKGFNTWMDENASTRVIWSPENYEKRTYYDVVNQDLYFTTTEGALLYSENLGNFVSFLDYTELNGMFNMHGNFYALRYDGHYFRTLMWQLWAGNYNSFFGAVKPYWLTFISNTDPTVDKIYNTLDWRSTTYTNTDGVFGTLKPLDTFDTIRVWNDYQDTLQTSLELKAGASSNLKKKFNVFRAQIPRDKRAELTSSQRDRIRSPWAYVQLAKVKPNYDLMVFNDLTVNFFE